MRVAAIDVGTNTVRLMIARGGVDRGGADRGVTGGSGGGSEVGSEVGAGGGFSVLHRENMITRLGEGMGSGRLLNGEAISRTIEVLYKYRELLESYEVSQYRAVTTSAVREAKNGQEFITLTREGRKGGERGVDVEVISSSEEARLVIRGVSSSINISKGTYITFDIGGGSTEFIFSEDGDVKDVISTDLGVVRLLEMFIVNNPPKGREIEELQKFVDSRVKMVYNYFDLSNQMHKKPIPLVGTAGTVTSLGAISIAIGLKLEKYDPMVVDGFTLRYKNLKAIIDSLLHLKNQERLLRYPILGKGREDVILPGALIVKSIMDRFKVKALTVSDRGLLEGIIESILVI